jgi:meso-butanediol dehydrogenase/(S,S)-butanediol dehydrogenase/diacetyl reductase
MTMARLAGKKALVTGGSEGIGRAITSAFITEGAEVVIAALDDEHLGAAAAELGCPAIPMDLGSVKEVDSAVQQAVDLLGGLDILVNNAAVVSPSKSVETTSLDELQRLLDVNLRGSFWMMQQAHPYLKAARGCVLNVSSMAGVVGQTNHAAYSMTKGGLNALTKSAAADWGPDRIRVNAMCPTGVWTGALRRWAAEQPNPEEIDDYLNRIHALGYCPETDEISPAAVFLCSHEASFITGHILHISGGSEVGYRL